MSGKYERLRDRVRDLEEQKRGCEKELEDIKDRLDKITEQTEEILNEISGKKKGEDSVGDFLLDNWKTISGAATVALVTAASIVMEFKD